MSRIWLSIQVVGISLMAAAIGCQSPKEEPANTAKQEATNAALIDQNLDQATLHRYHHTDQGTVLMPAAWLAALEKADGSGKFMDSDNMRNAGFIVDNTVDASNPYGWPIGFTVSTPKKTGDVPIAGITCAACHTGQLEYKGTTIRVEGGQGMIDSAEFFGDMFRAFVATTKNESRREKFYVDAIKAGYPADRMDVDFKAAVARFPVVSEPPAADGTKEGLGRSDAVQGIANRVFGHGLMVPANIRPLSAPVSFPPVWDIWRLSWVQYNGFQPGDKAQARNIGEVLGVIGTTNIVDRKNGKVNPEPLRWQTSVNLDNLVWMEATLHNLKAPTWPEGVLGKIDQAKAARGKELFIARCASCHGIKELPNGMWDVTVVPLEKLGTDPNATTNFSADTYDASKLGLSKKTHAPDGLAVVTNSVRRQLYADNNTPADRQETDYAAEAPCGYKARPLIGVWATPPFLHNGSVRTIFDLLSDTRPAKFTVGSREYDPVTLGYTEGQGLTPFVLDTSINGNSNAGHWFTDDVARRGRIGAKFSDEDKYAIIEFLKAANYDNYPSEKRAKEAVMPCQGNKTWAVKK
jgi:mono/diheme cytochrome c family protein